MCALKENTSRATLSLAVAKGIFCAAEWDHRVPGALVPVQRTFLFCDYPYWWKEDAICHVNETLRLRLNEPREAERVMALFLNDARAKRTVRHPVSGPIVKSKMSWADGGADGSLPPLEGFIVHGLRPQDKRRTENHRMRQNSMRSCTSRDAACSIACRAMSSSIEDES